MSTKASSTSPSRLENRAPAGKLVAVKAETDRKKDTQGNSAGETATPATKASAKKSRASLKRKADDEDDKADDPACDSCGEAENDRGKPAKRTKSSADPAKSKAKTSANAAAVAAGGVGTTLAARTDVKSLKKAMYIGAHVSSAGGVQNAVANSAQIGGNAFALFLKSQRKWQNPPLADEARDGFVAACAQHGYDAARHCLPHGSYLVNLAQADAAKAQQAYDTFVDDLRRCNALGIRLYNFHPGANVAGSGSREDVLARIAAALNRAHRDSVHAADPASSVVTVIENMAGAGTTVGDRFEDLRAIIDGVDDKSRVAVCLDTCHAFAAGYDLRSPTSFAAVLAEFDRIVGLSYLRAVHLNDSKAPLGSRRDLHANIGTGFLGLRAFHSLVNHDAFAGLPIVLETPIDRPGPDGKQIEDRQVWADEIKLLESLVGLDPDTDAFRAREKELQAVGAAERKRVQAQVDKKSGKAKK